MLDSISQPDKSLSAATIQPPALIKKSYNRRYSLYLKFSFIFIYLRHFIAQLLILKPFFRIFFNLKVYGLEKTKNAGGPLIIISNHKHMLDSFVITAALPFFSSVIPMRAMAETKHFRSPYLNFLLRVGIVQFVYWWFSAFPVIRGEGIEKALIKPRKIITEGGVVLIHPEGRVVKNYDIEIFKRGAAILAQSTNTPILPIALRITKKSGKIRPFYIINFGDTFVLPRNVSDEEGSEMLRKLVIKLYQEIS
ncbi:MAG: hypothetical protein A2909_02460 [Candidatus Tagabacteria bacterium RIFCSPLOWO2_01_FULL_39_11]|uniref:Phospholipid/glycerol acyltransferase domain-containing protein n=1 Tax=Candidatus Tagabacteria bacterium RIFCSPLOWO2_01_FULL_39_11 TaxID=1802295 RepID=A0A1G2LQP3_9BACT|nr:MAG: hypothetical protein A2909_02460 [Candidatus Tagabacteria bacterium RIFCSPLOWO2_01_FULL_39_11]